MELADEADNCARTGAMREARVSSSEPYFASPRVTAVQAMASTGSYHCRKYGLRPPRKSRHTPNPASCNPHLYLACIRMICALEHAWLRNMKTATIRYYKPNKTMTWTRYDHYMLT